MPNPMAILQAGADITSRGMPSQPTIPKTMTGMTQILAVMARVTLSDLDTIHAIKEKIIISCPDRYRKQRSALLKNQLFPKPPILLEVARERKED